MKVLGIAILDEAKRKYPFAKSSISRWKTITDGANWKHFEELKQHFRASDPVGKCVVFDVKHNDFRLIAIVDYARSIVIVKAFLKHSDYDENRWKNECGC
jgi:mRNA interferase HigB